MVADALMLMGAGAVCLLCGALKLSHGHRRAGLISWIGLAALGLSAIIVSSAVLGR